jgi:hypothetical protein
MVQRWCRDGAEVVQEWCRCRGCEVGLGRCRGSAEDVIVQVIVQV